jgi:23S rRNA (cytidine1920-2'-O)/16S rRNA (cytidine1409-2'-O)-methyltransferase
MKFQKPSRDSATEDTKRKTKSGKARLDVLIVERGLAPSRERAQALLLAGQIRVNGAPAGKPGTQIATDAEIELSGETLRYASRGGLKLEGALEDFGVIPENKVCLDAGSSTGGFTDCLLQRGASKVYAVDVTIDQLDWKVRQDKRVVTIEKNARYLLPEDVGELVDLVVMDVSFISATKVLPAVIPIARTDAEFLILIKPQFELERRSIGKGGIVRDPAFHQEAIDRVTASALELGLEVSGVKPSRLAGAQGNQEFFLHAHRRG